MIDLLRFLRRLGGRVLPATAWGALVLSLAACGGGVETGGTGGDATAYAAGPVTGFGSVIVGGVRFDDAGAEVEDGEGTRRSRDELRLGMTVEVESGPIANGTATARRVRFDSELVGPVGLVDVAAGGFTMLGQRVVVDQATLFDDRLAGGLSALRLGDRVEVYAEFDAAAQRYRATRVEPAGLLAGFRLRGPVSQLDTTARTLRVGGATYSYATAAGVPAGLAVGQFVRLRLEVEPFSTTRWEVRSFGVALRPLADAASIEVEGLVSAFTSASSFAVAGRPVDASAAALSGSLPLALGARVEVEGRLVGGVLRATRVEVRSESELRDRGFELTGAIASVSADRSSFVLRGVTVFTTRPDLRLEGGTLADLAVGRQVEVRGPLSTDARGVAASRIRFRN